MFFRVLGPLEVEVGTERITIPGTRPRALLVALLLQPNAAVSRVPAGGGAVGGRRSRTTPANALHQVVRRLRSQLGPLGDAVRTRAPGIRAGRPSSVAIDAERFEAGYAGRAGSRPTDPAAAVAVLDEALALWRGPAYGGVRRRVRACSGDPAGGAADGRPGGPGGAAAGVPAR